MLGPSTGGINEWGTSSRTGYSALLGIVPRRWQATGAILEQFSPTPARARRAYQPSLQAGFCRGIDLSSVGGPSSRKLFQYLRAHDTTHPREVRAAWGGQMERGAKWEVY